MTSSPRHPDPDTIRLSDIVRAAQRSRSSHCLPIERIHALAAGHLSAAEERSIRAHVDACAGCSAELKLALAFERPEHASDSAAIDQILKRIAPYRPSSPVRPLPPRPVAPWLLAAAAALLLGITVGPRLFDPGPPPIQGGGGQGGGDDDVQRGQDITVEAPTGEVAPGAVTFRWSAVPGAARYHVVVKSGDDRDVFDQVTPDTKISSETIQSGRFRPASVYYWTVTALGEGGETVGRSSVLTFRTSVR